MPSRTLAEATRYADPNGGSNPWITTWASVVVARRTSNSSYKTVILSAIRVNEVGRITIAIGASEACRRSHAIQIPARANLATTAMRQISGT